MLLTPSHTLTLFATLGLTGCGDSLLSGPNLDGLLGTTPPTTLAAWEFRWATEDGLVVDCELVDAGVNESIPVVVGQVEVPPPRVDATDVPVWQALDGAEYAILLPVLVESELHEPIDSEGDEGTLEADHGIWGITAPVALVVARGDYTVVSDHLVFEGAEPLSFVDDVAWVELISEVVELRGTLIGSLTPMEPADRAEIQRDGIPVTSVAYALSDAAAAWGGATLGGVRPTEACFEDADDDEDDE